MRPAPDQAHYSFGSHARTSFSRTSFSRTSFSRTSFSRTSFSRTSFSRTAARHFFRAGSCDIPGGR
ncbi:pentapeptide repeat-containing protein [Halothiobacillus diazotrophicus]|uniref:pentapeptide repeat-containing protein n=1 Tax=Halothiobacillus diazotrophicus TaxID=1860122 RepID=UPI003898DE98